MQDPVRTALQAVSLHSAQTGSSHANQPTQRYKKSNRRLRRPPPARTDRTHLSRNASESGKHGTVHLLVEVDANGVVTGAQFERGPTVLRGRFETASRLRFSPATKDGVPVAANTRVTFHYAPPTGLALIDRRILAEITVHRTNVDNEDTRARTTIEEAELERVAGEDFANVQVAGYEPQAPMPMPQSPLSVVNKSDVCWFSRRRPP